MSTTRTFVAALPAVWLIAAAANAQTAAPPLSITFPPAETHRLESTRIGAAFDVHVVLPPLIPGENARFPVVYMTDATREMVISDTMLRLMMLVDTPRFIAVGIGYAGADSYFQTTDVRRRDLTDVAAPAAPTGAIFEHSVTTAVPSGGASAFLDFIRDELIPFIDARYPTDRTDRTYAGHSLGGLFGCYVLFTRPDTFARYVIGSPSLYWGDAHLFRVGEEYSKQHRDLRAKVFLGVGALEEAADDPTVTNVRRLDSFLRKQKFPNLTLTTRVFPEETHLTVWPTNLVRGLVSVLGTPARGDTLLAKYRARLAASQTSR